MRAFNILRKSLGEHLETEFISIVDEIEINL